MNKLNELHNQISDAIKFMPIIRKKFYEYGEICELINKIADYSSYEIARALNDTIKEISYMSTKSHKECLEDVIFDFCCGMNEIDVLLKYEDIIYKMKGWL